MVHLFCHSSFLKDISRTRLASYLCFLLQALNPFYLFQAYTVILWSIQMYWKFAVIIAITSVLSVTASVWETRRVSNCLSVGHLAAEARRVNSSSDFVMNYSYLPNKRAGWKIGQKNNRAGLNNRVGWKNYEKFNNCAG